MKVVILAAGVGSRLGDSDLPKPLTLLANGKTILQLQVENLVKHVSVDDIMVVVGYRFELIVQAFPDLDFVYNPDFAKENTSKSLLRAVEQIENEDLLWLNGDIVFKDAVISKILAFNRTAMVVNQGPVDEEGVKYRTDGNGAILEVSKSVSDPEGEALGINLFKAKDLSSLKQNLANCRDDDYFEKAIEASIQQGTNVHTSVVDFSDCIEIDFPEDLAKVNNIQNW